MRRILWCIISLCLILLSLALLLRFRDDAAPLPAPLENVVSQTYLMKVAIIQEWLVTVGEGTRSNLDIAGYVVKLLYRG